MLFSVILDPKATSQDDSNASDLVTYTQKMSSPSGFRAKSLPSRFAWNKELICASPGPEWLRIMKCILKQAI